MKYYDSKGLEVDFTETDSDGEIAMLINAQYVNETDGNEVPENELMYLEEKYAEQISEIEFEKQIGAGEDYFEGDR